MSLYKIDAAQVAAAIDHAATQPLPDPTLVFPWLHGLHPANQIQQAFFVQKRRARTRTPACLRGITLVKADGDLGVARLKGAIAPCELLPTGSGGEFLEIDPREGFSVRNFQIQAAKYAMTSDIIIYGDDDVQVRKLGWDIAGAQRKWREQHEALECPLPEYNAFICTSPFHQFEAKHAGIVAVDSLGRANDSIVDFSRLERKEMHTMTAASEISPNVWLGPTPELDSEEERRYDVLVDCCDLAPLNPAALRAIAESGQESVLNRHIEFPSSGSILPPTWSHSDADGILETCKWLYHLARGTLPSPSTPPADLKVDAQGDSFMSEAEHLPTKTSSRPRKILIHCLDGYTESTMLAIAYYSYSTGRAVPDAWLHLHTSMKRNFFAYPTDVALLTSIATRLLSESPECANKSLGDITALIKNEPKWLAGLDGSFPSRVLDYMYLGNLGHANNPDLLKAMGICQILSVGETAMWRDGELDAWGHDNVCVVGGVQDNGIDPLTNEFERCLEFIDRGRRNGTATLVHCRVGVSRSATICIAEVMRSAGLSFPRAYCFVRARRLNVIIQPHLRFVYELLKWEETLLETANGQLRREMCWGQIGREIARLNSPYK